MQEVIKVMARSYQHRPDEQDEAAGKNEKMNDSRIEFLKTQPSGHAKELTVQQEVKYLVLEKCPYSFSQRVKTVIRLADSPEPDPAVECINENADRHRGQHIDNNTKLYIPEYLPGWLRRQYVLRTTATC